VRTAGSFKKRSRFHSIVQPELDPAWGAQNQSLERWERSI
jgi:hypothetical protein